jgi:ABC-type phosphate/phosphonate transport system permease subunit
MPPVSRSVVRPLVPLVRQWLLQLPPRQTVHAVVIGDGQFVARRPVGVFGCFGVGGLGELLLQSTVIAYWFKVVLAMMWKPVTTSGSMATTVSA